MPLVSIVRKVFILLVSVSSSAMLTDCLYGWQWSESLQKCIVECNSGANNEAINIYCRFDTIKGVQITMNNTSENVMLMSSGKRVENVSVPNCYNMTLQKGSFYIKDDGLLHVGEYFMPLSNYRISKLTGSVTFCYPLSPQFLHCEHDITHRGHYLIDAHYKAITVNSTGSTAYLGDYYVTDAGDAITCKHEVINNISVVNYYSVPRCNYITLVANQFEMRPNGSLYIYPLRKEIEYPLYTIVIDRFTRICYPLAISFMNCPYGLQELSSYSYEVNSDYTISSYFLETVYYPDNFFILNGGGVVLCSAQNVMRSTGAILYFIFDSIYIISAFALFITLVVQRKAFYLNVHTKCMFCHIICLIVMNICQGIEMFNIKSYNSSCFFRFVIDYFFSISMLLWLNVFAYASWRCFKRLPSQVNFSKNAVVNCRRLRFKQTSSFVYYNIYAWGGALLLSLILSMTYFVTSLCDLAGLACPRLGSDCWFYSIEAFLIFYGAPFCFITFVNVVFSVLTVILIRRCSVGTELVNQKSKQQVFRVSAKILAITSICYILDFCFYLMSNNSYYLIIGWYLSTSITSFQGLVVTIVFCSKAEHMRTLH